MSGARACDTAVVSGVFVWFWGGCSSRRRARRPHSWLHRLATVTAILAVTTAGVITTNTTDRYSGALILPGATADPTGPTGPGGQGGINGDGSQFQPPQIPSMNGGYSGGNYPNPAQGNGIDINNPTGMGPEYNQAPQYPQQSVPTQRIPVHGTQPPDYDAPLQQVPQHQAPQQMPQQQEPPEPPGTQQQEPSNELGPSPDNGSGQQPSDDPVIEEDFDGSEDNSQLCEGNVSQDAAGVEIKNPDPFRNHEKGSNSVDKRELVYEVHSEWAVEFETAINNWKKAVGEDRVRFRHVHPNNGANLTIVDNRDTVDDPDWTSANSKAIAKWRQYPRFLQDEIVTNASVFDDLAWGERVSAFAHEIGHALGLAHSCTYTLMYFKDYSPAQLLPYTGPQPVDVKMFDIIWPKQ